eukprot:SAG11_NODE_1621_length_4562_cov_2.009187_6_plen_39_part_01
MLASGLAGVVPLVFYYVLPIGCVLSAIDSRDIFGRCVMR